MTTLPKESIIMSRKKHPNKHIEAALKHAEDNGWMIDDSGGHCWGKMLCPINAACRGGHWCMISIWSTPKNPQNHAKQLKSVVDKCESDEADK